MISVTKKVGKKFDSRDEISTVFVKDGSYILDCSHYYDVKIAVDEDNLDDPRCSIKNFGCAKDRRTRRTRQPIASPGPDIFSATSLSSATFGPRAPVADQPPAAARSRPCEARLQRPATHMADQESGREQVARARRVDDLRDRLGRDARPLRTPPRRSRHGRPGSSPAAAPAPPRRPPLPRNPRFRPAPAPLPHWRRGCRSRPAPAGRGNRRDG